MAQGVVIFAALLTSIFLFGTIGLLIYWILTYKDGFGWRDEPLKMFNLHPLLMCGGFILSSGISMMSYRLFSGVRHGVVKLLHAFLHLVSIGLIGVGAYSVYEYKESGQTTHLYSLHSWIGLSAMGLFAIQFLFGFLTFLCCNCEGFKAAVMPAHAAMGIIIFALAVAAAAMGLTEMALFTLGEKYDLNSMEAIFINAIGGSAAAGLILITLYLRS